MLFHLTLQYEFNTNTKRKINTILRNSVLSNCQELEKDTSCPGIGSRFRKLDSTFHFKIPRSIPNLIKNLTQTAGINIVFQSILIKYYLLSESEVITGKSQTSTLTYWPRYRSVNTSRPRSEISLYWSLSIKTPEVIFHNRLRALWLSLSLILKKYL